MTETGSFSKIIRCVWNHRQQTQSRNLVILSVIYHCQNYSELIAGVLLCVKVFLLNI